MKWITKNGRHIPIGKSRRRVYYPKIYFRPLTVSEQIQRRNLRLEIEREKTKSALTTVLDYAPLISELHTGYQLADTIFDNLGLISQTYEAYNKYGLTGVANKLGTEVAQNALSDIQTELAWYTIAKFVPPAIHSEGKRVLSAVMDKVTSAEISFCKKFLQEENSKASYQTASRCNYVERPRQNSYNLRMPDSVRYV